MAARYYSITLSALPVASCRYTAPTAALLVLGLFPHPICSWQGGDSCTHCGEDEVDQHKRLCWKRPIFILPPLERVLCPACKQHCLLCRQAALGWGNLHIQETFTSCVHFLVIFYFQLKEFNTSSYLRILLLLLFYFRISNETAFFKSTSV